MVFKPGQIPFNIFKPGNPGRPKTYTPDMVLPALIKARGIMTRAVKLMREAGHSICWDTMRRMIQESPELQQLIPQIREAALGNIEDLEWTRAEKGDQKAIQFLLSKLDPKFRNKTELTGEGGGPIQAAIVEPIGLIGILLTGFSSDSLDRGERVEMARLSKKVEAAGGVEVLSVDEFGRWQALVSKGKEKDVTPEAA